MGAEAAYYCQLVKRTAAEGIRLLVSYKLLVIRENSGGVNLANIRAPVVLLDVLAARWTPAEPPHPTPSLCCAPVASNCSKLNISNF